MQKDNNLRYVALQTLVDVAQSGEKSKETVLRNLDIILDCLKDFDLVIRKKAFDLLFELVSPANVKQLTHEFLKYLNQVKQNDAFSMNNQKESKKDVIGASTSKAVWGASKLSEEVTRKVCSVIFKYGKEIGQEWQIQALHRVILVGSQNFLCVFLNFF